MENRTISKVELQEIIKHSSDPVNEIFTILQQLPTQPGVSEEEIKAASYHAFPIDSEKGSIWISGAKWMLSKLTP